MRPLGLLPVGREEEGREIIRAAARLGVGLFDTAPIYGFGESERRFGEVAADLAPSVVLATKVGKVLGPSAPRRPARVILRESLRDGPAGMARLISKTARVVGDAISAPRRTGVRLASVTDYTYGATMRSVEESLVRARRDRFEIVFIHDPDEHLPAARDGAYLALDRLRSEGTVVAVGASSNRSSTLVELAETGGFDCFLVAGRYSLLDQSALDELLPMAQDRGIAMIIGGVFNSGILADPAGKPFFDYAPASQEQLAAARRLDEIARRHGVSLKAAALHFPFGHPAVTSVVVGAESVGELEEDWALFGTPIPAEFWEECRDQKLLARGAPVPSGS